MTPIRALTGCLAALILTAGAARADDDKHPRKVVVENTASNPVPITGTVTVSNASSLGKVTVTNFPASQPVTGTVAVSSLPAVSGNVAITNLPSTQAVSGSVSINNSTAAPVNVADVEKLARVPYQSSVRVVCNFGPGACFFFFATPPAGTRLVAEQLSGYFQIDPTVTKPIVGYVEDGSPNFTVFTGFTATLAGNDAGGHQQAAFSQPQHFYVEGGDGVFAVVSTTWSNGANVVILSGYLENCSVTGCPAIVH